MRSIVSRQRGSVKSDVSSIETGEVDADDVEKEEGLGFAIDTSDSEKPTERRKMVRSRDMA